MGVSTTAIRHDRMDAREYFSRPALSNSGLSDLAVSPLRYWAKHLDPNREIEPPTPFMIFGSALHCAVLEPNEFYKRYACVMEAAEGCLDRVEDLKSWLRAHGVQPKGTLKSGLIAQVQMADPDAPIWSVLQQEFAAANEGKTFLKQADWDRCNKAADSLRSEPRIKEILAEGSFEVSLFANDPDTGVPLKGRLDWISEDVTLDLKTFSQSRGKSIDGSVSDAIFYERYHRQGYMYRLLRALNEGKEIWNAPDHLLAFVESEWPHETRLRLLRPKVAGEVSLLYEQARIEVRSLIALYADCVEEFGNKPWRRPQVIQQVVDEDIRQLAYS